MDIEGSPRGSSLSLTDFTLLKTVGKGNFGKVYQVRKKDSGKIFAMKVLNKAHSVTGQKNYERTLSERKIVEEMNHPFLASLRYAFQVILYLSYSLFFEIRYTCNPTLTQPYPDFPFFTVLVL
jgi:serine/threonine protein kinase